MHPSLRSPLTVRSVVLGLLFALGGAETAFAHDCSGEADCVTTIGFNSAVHVAATGWFAAMVLSWFFGSSREPALTYDTAHAGSDHVGGGVSTWLQQFGRGVWHGLVDTVKGIYDVVTDPIGAARGLYHAVTHPFETLNAMWDGAKQVVQGILSGDPEMMGRAVFEIAAAFVPVSKLGKIAKVADAFSSVKGAARVGNAVADAHRAGEAAETFAHVGRASHVGGLDRARRARRAATGRRPPDVPVIRRDHGQRSPNKVIAADPIAEQVPAPRRARPSAEFGDIKPHQNQGAAIKDELGKRISEHEHIRARVNLWLQTYDAMTGSSPVDRRFYRRSATLTTPTDMARIKTRMDLKLRDRLKHALATGDLDGNLVDELEIEADIERTKIARDEAIRARKRARRSTYSLEAITDERITEAAHRQQWDLFEVGKSQRSPIVEASEREIEDAVNRHLQASDAPSPGGIERPPES